jgi:hypothetical protein
VLGAALLAAQEYVEDTGGNLQKAVAGDHSELARGS